MAQWMCEEKLIEFTCTSCSIRRKVQTWVIDCIEFAFFIAQREVNFYLEWTQITAWKKTGLTHCQLHSLFRFCLNNYTPDTPVNEHKHTDRAVRASSVTGARLSISEAGRRPGAKWCERSEAREHIFARRHTCVTSDNAGRNEAHYFT